MVHIYTWGFLTTFKTRILRGKLVWQEFQANLSVFRCIYIYICENPFLVQIFKGFLNPKSDLFHSFKFYRFTIVKMGIHYTQIWMCRKLQYHLFREFGCPIWYSVSLFIETHYKTSLKTKGVKNLKFSKKKKKSFWQILSGWNFEIIMEKLPHVKTWHIHIRNSREERLPVF